MWYHSLKIKNFKDQAHPTQLQKRKKMKGREKKIE